MLTKKIPNWMIAAAITLGVAVLTPNTAQAQDCETCVSRTGECLPDQPYPNDRCLEGENDDGKWCSSWGRLSCEGYSSAQVGADGALLETETFAVGSLGPEVPRAEHVRDCRSRIVARSYTPEDAEGMRRRTESIVI